MGKSAGRIFAFSVFVFDTGTGELTRAGKRIRIPDQAARLLTVLLESGGAMLTRDDLKEALWPQGEVLDYEHSIHRVVSQLREILRDRSSKSAPLIETLPKRGYRFTGQARELEAPVEAPVSTPNPPQQPVDLAEHSPLEPVPEPEPLVSKKDRAKSNYRLWLVVTTVIALALVGLWLARERIWTANKPLSLGIVPFEATGDDSVPLAESFRFNLADVLSQSPEIETRAVHSFDHIGLDEKQIFARAQQLGVDVLLFGKFSVDGNQCQLFLELVRSRDGVHLGSFQYSGTREELAAISDRVERDIYERLHPYRGTANLNRGRPATGNAYAAYLRGRSYLQEWTDEALLRAIASFQEALTEDPSYARAYAGMASAYFVLSQHRGGYMEECRTNAAHALALDPSLAEGHAMLGQVALNADWNFPLAEEQLHRAVESDPDHAIYRQWLAILYGVEGNRICLSKKSIARMRPTPTGLRST